jgi:WD40 repeat protein
VGDGNGTPSLSAHAAGPYLGLRYYAEDDARWFYGRDEERETITANLRAARLTILYAQSGVGKSSLLRAGVARQLRDLAQRWLTERGSPRYLPVVFGAWKDDPLGDLITAIEHALEPFLVNGARGRLPRGELAQALAAASSLLDAKLLIILDQFEEYLLYTTREPPERRFADELARCLNQAQLRANFLIAIREDAYAGLGDLFAGKIANVYRNYLQLQYLDRDAAREAIVRPVERFNHMHADQQPVRVEPALVEAVLDQVRTGAVVVGEPGLGALRRGNGDQPVREEVETPYLQLVMLTLWAYERRRRSTVLRLATLRELGGAQEIVRAHLDGALTALAEQERDTAVDLFQYLVTPSGTKIVHTASDLAAMIDRPGEEVAELLAKLARGDTRVVRHVPPPAGKSQPDDRYEIFHDVLAPAIIDWRQRAVEQRRRAAETRERERLERERRAAEERALEEARRRRAFQRLAAGALALLAVAVLLGILALLAQRSAVSSQKTARSRQLAASAEATLSRDPELSTLLALQALHVTRTAQAEAALRDAVPQLDVLKALHAGSPLYTAALSPTGSEVLTAGSDGVARVWDAASGRQLLSIRVGGVLSGAAFSRDGRELLTASPEGGATIWNAASGQRLGVLGQATNVEVAAFSPDGTRVATAGYDRKVRIWNAFTGREIRTLSGARGAVRSVAFSPDGSRVLTASEDGIARVWDAGSGAPLALLHSPGEAMDTAAFSPDGMRIATAGTGGTARIWDAASGRQLAIMNGHTGTVYSVAFSPDGSELLTASEDGTARIWDAASGRQLNILTGDIGTVRSAAFGPDGIEVVTASEDGTARIWDATPRELRVVLDKGPTNGAAFSPKGTVVVTGGYDGTARIWDAASGRQVVVLRGHSGPITSASFSPDGTEVLTASEDGTARIWDARRGTLLAVLRNPDARSYGLLDAAFSPDGTKVATASEDGTASIWDIALMSRAVVLGSEGSGYRIYSASFSPDGRYVVTASEDGTVRIWGAASGEQLDQLSTHKEIALSASVSPDSTELVTAGADGTARIWAAATGKQLVTLSGHSGPVTSAEFSGDGTRVLTASADGTARIWDTGNGRQLAVLNGQAGRVNGAAFSPDGREVVTASADMAAIWSTELAGSVQSLERIAEARLIRQLTPEERRTYGISG